MEIIRFRILLKRISSTRYKPLINNNKATIMRKRKRVLVFIIAFCFVSILCKAQDSLQKRTVLAFTPSKANVINGIAFGLWTRPTFNYQKIRGFNIELIGSGWQTPFLSFDDGGYLRKSTGKQEINGLSFGLTLLNGKVNSLAISPFINTTYYQNGLKISLLNVNLYSANGFQLGFINVNKHINGIVLGLYNKSEESKGLQLGLYNKTESSSGIQIGLININKSRTMVFFNW